MFFVFFVFFYIFCIFFNFFMIQRTLGSWPPVEPSFISFNSIHSIHSLNWSVHRTGSWRWRSMNELIRFNEPNRTGRSSCSRLLIELKRSPNRRSAALSLNALNWTNRTGAHVFIWRTEPNRPLSHLLLTKRSGIDSPTKLVFFYIFRKLQKQKNEKI